MTLEGTMVGDLTYDEWKALPVNFGTETMAKVLGRTPQFVYKNSGRLGVMKIGGRLYFSKPRVAKMLGIDDI